MMVMVEWAPERYSDYLGPCIAVKMTALELVRLTVQITAAFSGSYFVARPFPVS